MQFISRSNNFNLIILPLILFITSVSFANEDSANFKQDDSFAVSNKEQTINKPNNISSKAEKNNLKSDKSHKSARAHNHKHKTSFRRNDPFYGKHLCSSEKYECVAVKKGDSWNSLFPDKYERELVQRLNRTNQGLWNRSWVLVPKDLKKDYMEHSPFPTHTETDNKKTIIVSYEEQAFGAYDEKGNLVHWGPVSPGKHGTRTALGENFKIYRKGGANCWSKKFEATIPYCMFFNGGFALHGFTMPGYPASHGCVRMYNEDAKWLNRKFADFKTRVIVR